MGIRSFWHDLRHGEEVPDAAKRLRQADQLGLQNADPGPTVAITEGLQWLRLAQDNSKSRDGGIARHFSLIDGWASSYPETTGYIVQTLLMVWQKDGSADLYERARRMLDWLVSIQLPDGAFQGGMVDQKPRLAATFDTGQVAIGLAAAAKYDSRYHSALRRACDWLVDNQDPDGCWRKVQTPFAARGEKTYETHAAIGLFRASSIESDNRYLDAAIRQVNWALSQQTENGWFKNCCLTDQARPLTHTVGYALRGIIEAYLATGNEQYLRAARCTADGLKRSVRSDGWISGRLNARWKPQVPWACLTGSAQLSECFFILYQLTQAAEYLDLGSRVICFVRRTLTPDDRFGAEARGAVRGSFPIDGRYGRWQFINWGCKFMIDACMAEHSIAAGERDIVFANYRS